MNTTLALRMTRNAGAVVGVTLATRPEQIYRALMEGTAL